MKIKIVTLAVAAFAALAMSLAPALAPAASAAATPVAYTQWSYKGAQVRPAYIPVYMGNALSAHTWKWSSWKRTYAYSLGTLHVNQCRPYCAAGHYKYYTVGVTLSAVKTHGATKYFSKMVLSFWASGRHHVNTYHYKGMWG